jgi:hypothetical protein
MSRLFRFFAFIGIVAIGLTYATGVGHGQYFGKAKDWKDIYILPTNPNPQNNIKLTLSAEKQSLKPGDELKLTFTADRECYLTLMDMGTSGKILRLWPNDYSGQDNRIGANSPRTFPGPGDKFRYRISAPNGTENIIAYATSEKGKILSEQEFMQLKNTGFKEYRGSAKDLAIEFKRRTDTLDPNMYWGTAQTNILITSDSALRPDPRPDPPPEVRPQSALYMMCVAAQQHDRKLKHCNTDAQRMAEVFQSKLGIEKSNTKVFIDADYQAFVSGIQWLASNTRPEDGVIIYYRGHGGQVRDRPPIDDPDGLDEFLYLHPGRPNNMRDDEAIRKKIYLLDDELNVLLKKIPARKKIFISDSCHSGSQTKDVVNIPEMASQYEPSTDHDSAKNASKPKMKSKPTNYGNDNETVLGACLDNEVSWEINMAQEFKGGVLTHFLLDAIEKGSPDMESAFREAKINTIRFIQDWPKKYPDKKPPSMQTPCLTDPHGLLKELRFRN